MSEPTIEEQAIMKLKLEESVRELIRKEITSAFADTKFVDSVRAQLRKEIFGGAEWDYEFQRALKGYLFTQLNKG